MALHCLIERGLCLGNGVGALLCRLEGVHCLQHFRLPALQGVLTLTRVHDACDRSLATVNRAEDLSMVFELLVRNLVLEVPGLGRGRDGTHTASLRVSA